MNKSNYCVIMAGGIGSRFWPFSRNNRPKQFLDFFGTGRSLLQMTVDRFRTLVPVENVLVVTNAAYKATILEQVPDLPAENILCEPCRRNTAPCIAYAMARIRAHCKGGNANVVVAASDHLITNEQEFCRVIAEGLGYVAKHDCLLTLGMRPTRPETGYGYIQIDRHQSAAQGSIMPVKTFTEKPNRELAEVFFKSGEFLWNSGMFLWNIDAIMNALHRYLPELMLQFDLGVTVIGTDSEEAFIQEHFPQCPNISIDYGVMEKASNVMVMEADFGWSDLGTWGSLYDLSDKDNNGNVSLHSQSCFYDAQNNIVTLESGKLAVIEGLENYIIAENEGVLLICRKQNEQHIRQMVNDIQVLYNGKYS